MGLWQAKALGTQHDDGFELACSFKGQEVNASDAYGMTLVEGIWRGMDWRCRLRGLEWNKAGLIDAMLAFGQSGQASGTFSPSLENIGARMTAFSQALLLTAILANPPCTPQTLTATNAIIAPNSQTAFNLTSKMRETPLEFALIPYSGSVGSLTKNIPFSTT